MKKPAYKPSVPKTKSTASAGGHTGGASGGANGKKVTELQNELAEVKLTADTLEKERDFYFGKLRDIEVLLQNYQDQDIPQVEMVMKILYATEDEKVEIDENGNLTITNADGEPVGDAAAA